MEIVGRGRLEQAKKKQVVLGDYLGEHVWVILVGPKLKAGAKIRKAVNY